MDNQISLTNVVNQTFTHIGKTTSPLLIIFAVEALLLFIQYTFPILGFPIILAYFALALFLYKIILSSVFGLEVKLTFKLGLKYAVLVLAVGIFVFLGFLFLIIPGLIIGFFTAYSHIIFLLDEKMSIRNSIRSSYSVAKENAGITLKVLILYGLLYSPIFLNIIDQAYFTSNGSHLFGLVNFIPFKEHLINLWGLLVGIFMSYMLVVAYKVIRFDFPDLNKTQ